MSTSTPSEPVRIHYTQLRDNAASVLPQIKEAFGSEQGSLGIILIDELPDEYAQLRSTLFRLIHRLANLPEDEREKLARPESSYLFGWSHGKEIMNGKPDTRKGSFYVNPLIDLPDVDDKKRLAHPEYYSGNVWPRGTAALEDFESTCKALGRLVYDAGLALAKACQPFGELGVIVRGSRRLMDPVEASASQKSSSSSSSINVESLIASSQSNKARLLHYYPETSTDHGARQVAEDSLCGTHVDHSLLTGLCSAMYLHQPSSEGEPREVSAPTKAAGLYIHPRADSANSTRKAEPVKVSIPPDCLAFQIGEALELLTNGRLAATPHFVNGSPGSTRAVSRETFAFFLQPDVDDVVGSDGETFGAFTKRVLGRHYAKAAAEAED